MVALFANKADCAGRAVSRQEATTFANINGIQIYEEISAQKGGNVDKALSQLLDRKRWPIPDFVDRSEVEDRERVKLNSRSPAASKCCA